MLRAITFIIIALATAAWLWLLFTLLLVGGMMTVFAAFVSAMFLSLLVPAFILALKGKLLGLALTQALLSFVALAWYII